MIDAVSCHKSDLFCFHIIFIKPFLSKFLWKNNCLIFKTYKILVTWKLCYISNSNETLSKFSPIVSSCKMYDWEVYWLLSNAFGTMDELKWWCLYLHSETVFVYIVCRHFGKTGFLVFVAHEPILLYKEGIRAANLSCHHWTSAQCTLLMFIQNSKEHSS